MLLLMKSLHFKWYILASVLISLSFSSMCPGQEGSEPYSDRLLKVVLTAGQVRAGFALPLQGEGRLIDSRHGKLRPYEGLDKSDAVPFLINVLRNGPDWTDEKLLRARGGMFPHIARCFAAINLGAMKEPRAFEPLVEMLQHGDFLENKYRITYGRKNRYDIRKYAALGLGQLQDIRAVDPLISVLESKESDSRLKGYCMSALARVGEIRAIRAMIRSVPASNAGMGMDLNDDLRYMTKMTFHWQYSDGRKKVTVREFPELGVMNAPAPAKVRVWRHWLKVGDKLAEQEFKSRHSQWKEVKQTRPKEKAAIKHAYRKMSKVGIAGLPFMIEKVKAGEITLIPLISELTSGKLKKTATQAQCLAWWGKNKQKWLIPWQDLTLEKATTQPAKK